MTDIIERLRMPIGANPYTGGPVYNELRMQAADAIERLLAVVRAIDELPLSGLRQKRKVFNSSAVTDTQEAASGRRISPTVP
jgi:hypothetical protein